MLLQPKVPTAHQCSNCCGKTKRIRKAQAALVYHSARLPNCTEPCDATHNLFTTFVAGVNQVLLARRHVRQPSAELQVCAAHPARRRAHRTGGRFAACVSLACSHPLNACIEVKDLCSLAVLVSAPGFHKTDCQLRWDPADSSRPHVAGLLLTAPRPVAAADRCRAAGTATRWRTTTGCCASRRRRPRAARRASSSWCTATWATPTTGRPRRPGALAAAGGPRP